MVQRNAYVGLHVLVGQSPPYGWQIWGRGAPLFL